MYLILYTYCMAPPIPDPLLREFLRDLTTFWPLAKGSLAEVRKPCIRPNCSACREGTKHRAFLFSFSRNGKRLCRYVPPDLVLPLRKALANGRRLEQRMFELGEEILLRHRRSRSMRQK